MSELASGRTLMDILLLHDPIGIMWLADLVDDGDARVKTTGVSQVTLDDGSEGLVVTLGVEIPGVTMKERKSAAITVIQEDE